MELIYLIVMAILFYAVLDKDKKYRNLEKESSEKYRSNHATIMELTRTLSAIFFEAKIDRTCQSIISKNFFNENDLIKYNGKHDPQNFFNLGSDQSLPDLPRELEAIQESTDLERIDFFIKHFPYKIEDLMNQERSFNKGESRETDEESIRIFKRRYFSLIEEGWTSWYSNGQKKEEGKYKDGTKKEGIWTYWYENGQKKEEENFKDGKKEGLGTKWHENGNKWLEVNYKDGKAEGLCVKWHENGMKEGEVQIKAGKAEGLWIRWNAYDGMKLQETIYKDGKKHGPSSWYKNDHKTWEENFKDGKKHGLETYWHENGQKKEERNYVNGKQEFNSLKEWDKNGNEI